MWVGGLDTPPAPVLLRFFGDELQVGSDVVGLLDQLIKVAHVRILDDLEVAGDEVGLPLQFLKVVEASPSSSSMALRLAVMALVCSSSASRHPCPRQRFSKSAQLIS